MLEKRAVNARAATRSCWMSQTVSRLIPGRTGIWRPLSRRGRACACVVPERTK